MAYDREAIKEHYNQHVNEGVSTHEALRQRRGGPAAPLKKFHNEIKRRLIYRFGYRADALLDYACGRGGDIHKWWTAEIKYVKGMDLSPKEVEEARRRYAELCAKESDCSLQAQFEQIDTLGLEVVVESQQYDLVTCMFALHYFFDAQQHCRTLLETVSKNLKPGGYFIATLPDGKRIKGQLLNNNGLLQQELLVLKQKWQGKSTSFGSSFVMEIPDTVVEGHEGLTEGSHEYLVFDKVLLAEAAKAGLYPVTDYDDPELDQLFEPSETNSAVKHFYPSYPPSTDSSLALASSLYMAVVLQKVDSAAAAHAPPQRPPPMHASGPRQQQQQSRLPQRERRSPTREERYAASDQPAAAGVSIPSDHGQAMQQQRQQDNSWRGPSFKRNDNWQLPYQAVVLPPDKWPSGYNNLKPGVLEDRHNKLSRFVVVQPPLPFYAGPVQWDAVRSDYVRQVMPDGRVIDSYYDELQYYEQQQQQTAGMPAAQQQFGGPPAAAAAPPAARPPPQQQQQQMQQYPGPPPQQQPAVEMQKLSIDSNDTASGVATAGDGVELAAGRGRGRGKGRGRAAATTSTGDGSESTAAGGGDEAPQGNRGRGGRGSRGGRGAAGTKRAREGTDSAAGAVAGEAGGGSETAAAEGAPAVKRPAIAAKPTAGASAPGPKFFKGPAPDPLGYKEKTVVVLAADVVEQLAELGPRYTEPVT